MEASRHSWNWRRPMAIAAGTCLAVTVVVGALGVLTSWKINRTLATLAAQPASNTGSAPGWRERSQPHRANAAGLAIAQAASGLRMPRVFWTGLTETEAARRCG